MASRWPFRSPARASLTPAVLALAIAGCDPGIDGSDIGDVFAKTTADVALAKPVATAPKSTLATRKRAPIAHSCVANMGEPATLSERQARRPACRRARVLERRDGGGSPRYGCVFAPGDLDERKPLPLVVFLHGERDDPTAVHKKTRLGRRARELDLTGDPRHRGFVILAPQARRIRYLNRWDVDYANRDNVDVKTIDSFVDTLLGEGLVDGRQIYVVGEGRGGQMAALYSMLRPDRVAAFATYGSQASMWDWTCDEPATPAAVVYRACDSITPCRDVEAWMGEREGLGQATVSRRLGAGDKPEPRCDTRCSDKRGEANHHRWPKHSEDEVLEFLSRYSLE